MRVLTELTGTSSLLCHNVALADQSNKWAREIREITEDQKKKKTEEGRAQIARLEWFGSLYLAGPGLGPVMPMANIRRCFQEAAKSTKQGKAITRSVSALGDHVPIVYDGPRDLEELSKLDHFRDSRIVVVSMQRVTRVRPVFHQWKIAAHWELLTDLMDLDNFSSIVGRAGLIEGLGDNRINGFGRFSANVRED